MAFLERILQRIYTLLLHLYPRPFRREFAAEMVMVFEDALSAARQRGAWAMLRLSNRELCALPRTLIHEYWQQDKQKERTMDNPTPVMPVSPNTRLVAGRQLPAPGWHEVLLAILPFLLIFFVDALPKVLVVSGLLTWEDPAMQALNLALYSLAGAALMLCFILAWRGKWPAWSRVWITLFLVPPVLLAGLLLNRAGGENAIPQAYILFITLLCLLAALLYAVTRLDRLGGLLVSLPLLYILWNPNLEFVPTGIKVAINFLATIVVCIAIVYLLRQADWRRGLLAVLVMNLLVGALYAWAGIYHGGALPYSAPGPNFVEVLRSLLPQYLAVSGILLGPFFASEIRLLGRAAGRSRAAYHLALAGLLLVILVMLVAISNGTTPFEMRPGFITNALLSAGLYLGLGIYLLGLLWVYWETRQSSGILAWAYRLLLLLLPLGIPLAFVMPFITWTRPLSDLYGVPLLWGMPHALSITLGLAWLLLSAWVVTRDGPPAEPQVQRTFQARTI